MVALDLQDLDELLQNMRAGPYPQLAWALERTVLLPLRNAGFAEQLPAVLALHGLDRDLQADSTDHGVFKLLMHLAVHDSLDVVAALVVGLRVRLMS